MYMYFHNFKKGEKSAEFENQAPDYVGAALLSGVDLMLSEWHPIGMPAPKGLYQYNRGQIRRTD